MAKRPYLLEILPERERTHHRSPKLFALEVAGLPFEEHEWTGTVVTGLLVHLMERDDVVAVVGDYPDLHRAGLVHLPEALLPVSSDSGLPSVFLVSERVRVDVLRVLQFPPRVARQGPAYATREPLGEMT